MKKLVFSLLPILMLVVSCTAQQSISVQEFEKRTHEKNIVILDVRTTQEFQGGHLKDALNIDWYSSDFAEKAGELDKEKEILIYCRSGARSNQAMQKLVSMGYKVTNMQGGIMSWQAAGYQVEK